MRRKNAVFQISMANLKCWPQISGLSRRWRVSDPSKMSEIVGTSSGQDVEKNRLATSTAAESV